MLKVNIIVALEEVLRKGRAYVNANSEQLVYPSEGYAVAHRGGVTGLQCFTETAEELADEDNITGKINDMAEKAVNTLCGETPYIGLVLSEGVLSIDVVDILFYRHNAEMFADDMGQGSVYGFAERAVLPVSSLETA